MPIQLNDRMPAVYRATTVFSQALNTDHLLMVPFDARIRNVSEYSYDWRSPSFDHMRWNTADSFTSLTPIGETGWLPAPGHLDGMG